MGPWETERVAEHVKMTSHHDAKVRSEIQEFAEALERVARKNEARGKGESWKSCGERWLVTGLIEEVGEFNRAETDADAADEALDVGLYAVFLYWRRARGIAGEGPCCAKHEDIEAKLRALGIGVV